MSGTAVAFRAGMTEADVRTLIRELERGHGWRTQWSHDEHLAMAVWYLTYLPRRQALRVIRRRVAEQGGAIGARRRYHETVTTFLARGVGAFLDALPDALPLDDRLARVLPPFRPYKALVRRYYTARAIESSAARAGWVEPDLRPMHEWLRSCAELAPGGPHAAAAFAKAS